MTQTENTLSPTSVLRMNSADLAKEHTEFKLAEIERTLDALADVEVMPDEQLVRMFCQRQPQDVLSTVLTTPAVAQARRALIEALKAWRSVSTELDLFNPVSARKHLDNISARLSSIETPSADLIRLQEVHAEILASSRGHRREQHTAIRFRVGKTYCVTVLPPAKKFLNEASKVAALYLRSAMVLEASFAKYHDVPNAAGGFRKQAQGVVDYFEGMHEKWLAVLNAPMQLQQFPWFDIGRSDLETV